MRAGVAMLGVLVLLAAPAAARPGESAKAESLVLEAGRWVEQLNAAMGVGSEGLEKISQEAQPLLAPEPTPEAAAAVAPGLRRLIERSRENVRRSEALLGTLPAFPKDMPTVVPSERMVAEARAGNRQLMTLLDHCEVLAAAAAAGDIDGVKKSRPRVLEAALVILGQKELQLRNRQVSFPATDSAHQAMAIGALMYRTMIAVARQGVAVFEGKREGAVAAAGALRAEMGLVATSTRALAATGRGNWRRELAESEIDRKRSSEDPAGDRLAEEAHAATILDGKYFDVGDRLAAFADSTAALSVEQLLQTSPRALFMPLTALEDDFLSVNADQLSVLKGSPK